MRTKAAACAVRAPRNPPVRPAGARFVRLGLHLIVLRLSCSTACHLRPAPALWCERSAVQSSQAVEQLSQSAIRCSPSLTKRAPAGRTGGFLGARAAHAAASVRMREGAATCRGLQCFSEPRSTGFWSATCPLSQAGHCAARGSRAHHRPDQLADWPRSAVRFIYCRLKPCDRRFLATRSSASTWALLTNSGISGSFSPRAIRRSNVRRA